jgi:hypothetical protein
MELEKYIDQINQLKPMATGFMYNTKNWQKLSGEHKIFVTDFEDKYVSRTDVTKAFVDYYSGNGDYMRAFLLTMIWGFADTGYGTHRTNNYITNPENNKLIKSAIDAVKNSDLKIAFNNLMKIKGLGISYITKILHFATKATGNKEYALIYDIRVASALVRLTTPPYIFEIVNVYPSPKFDDYQKYNKLIHRLSQQYNLEPDSIELFLFDQKFS